jgi:hypothetical protein
VISHKINPSDLAALAGVARENVSRVMSDWKRRKVVTSGVITASTLSRPSSAILYRGRQSRGHHGGEFVSPDLRTTGRRRGGPRDPLADRRHGVNMPLSTFFMLQHRLQQILL